MPSKLADRIIAELEKVAVYVGDLADVHVKGLYLVDVITVVMRLCPKPKRKARKRRES